VHRANEKRPRFTFATNMGGKELRGQFAFETRGTEEAKTRKGRRESNYKQK